MHVGGTLCESCCGGRGGYYLMVSETPEGTHYQSVRRIISNEKFAMWYGLTIYTPTKPKKKKQRETSNTSSSSSSEDKSEDSQTTDSSEDDEKKVEIASKEPSRKKAVKKRSGTPKAAQEHADQAGLPSHQEKQDVEEQRKLRKLARAVQKILHLYLTSQMGENESLDELIWTDGAQTCFLNAAVNVSRECYAFLRSVEVNETTVMSQQELQRFEQPSSSGAGPLQQSFICTSFNAGGSSTVVTSSITAPNMQIQPQPANFPLMNIEQQHVVGVGAERQISICQNQPAQQFAPLNQQTNRIAVN